MSLTGLITNRTYSDVVNKTDKGFYNTTDLNRVETAVATLSASLNAAGYAVDVTTKTNWVRTDIPTPADLERYINNSAAIRAALAVLPSTPQTPETMRFLTWAKANDIEQILMDVDMLITNMTQAWLFSNDLYSGEV